MGRRGLLAEHRENIGTRDITIPCCGVTVPPDTLRYDAPVGFARFQVCAMNPFRAGRWEPGTGELSRVADIFGHPVTQIIAGY